MTIDKIVVKLTIETMNVEEKITLLQTDVERIGRNLQDAYHLEVSDRLTREQKCDYIERLKRYQGFYQDILKSIIDTHYYRKKGARHHE